jgi:phosphotriesterase-related protein
MQRLKEPAMHAMTVLGLVPVADLGTTAIHEHLFIDTSSYWIRQFGRSKPEAVLDDEELAVAELAHFTAAGGRTLVDITPIGIGRNPEACRRVAQVSGLNIVVATGYYTHFFHPPELYEQTIDQIAAGMLAEIYDGIGATGIRPGMIKAATFLEIAPTEEKVLRAATRAQRASGYSIYTHTSRCAMALEQLAIFREEGADLSRIVIGHLNALERPLDYFKPIAATGVGLGFDVIGKAGLEPVSGVIWSSDAYKADRCAELVRLGHVDQIVLSADTCWKYDLRAYGGPGYDHVLRNFLPLLRERGVSEQAIHTMLVENPARLLTNHPGHTPEWVLNQSRSAT